MSQGGAETARGTGVARYTTVAIALHWMIAAAIVFQFVLGWRMELLKGVSGYAAFQLHKSIGITILLLSLARLGWRLGHRAPPSPPGQPAWERFAASAVHVGFYVIMIGMPLTGWAMVSASRIEIPTLLYGVVPWPHLPVLPGLPEAQKHAAEGLLSNSHELLAYLFMGLLVLHIGAVLKHQLIDRDAVLSHMAPGAGLGRWLEPRLIAPLVGVVAIAATVVALFSPPKAAPPTPAVAEAPEPVAPEQPEAAAPTPGTPVPEAAPVPTVAIEPSAWLIDNSSTLNFAASWSGEAVTGAFKTWTADVVFDPEALDASSVKVTIDVGSVSTGDAQRDSALPGADWFDAAKHPKAVFTATRLRKTGADRYVASGKLQLRGVSAPASLPFTVKIVGDKATASGSLSLDRTTYGVGQGEWASTDQIAGPVKVSFKITATRKAK